MKNFSNIKESLTTGRDHIVTDMVAKTGLSEQRIKKLYENFSFETGGDIKLIENKFNDLLMVSPNLNIEKTLVNINESLNDRSYNKVIRIVDTIDDSVSLLNIISKIIRRFSSVGNKSVERIEKELGKIDERLDNLFEAEKTSKVITIHDGSEIKNTIGFYADLKAVLSKNNKRWGNNYHLDNAYTAIWEYLNQEIEDLTNKGNVMSVTDTFHDELISMLIKGQINPMYQQIDVLRGMIPDIQTLVFDLIMMTTKFISDNKMALSFISQNKINEYFLATEGIYSKISTSRKASKVLMEFVEDKPIVQIDQSKDSNVSSFGISDYNLIYNIPWDNNKYDTWQFALQVPSIINAITIVKSCNNEFNLTIRPYLRNWVTKAFEIISRGEKIIIAHKQGKINNGNY